MRNAALREDMADVILDASGRLMERYGYKKMTMDDLAREAGIGKGTIYLYFRSKEEVALSCADRNFNRILEQERAIAKSSGPPAERLRQMLVQRVLLRFDSVQNYARSLDDLFIALRPAFLARREKWVDREAQVFADILVEGRLLGTFDVEDAFITARTLLMATYALMPFSLSPKELGARNDVQEKAERIADLLLSGVLRRTPLSAP
jgi:AcrR family transcriptional regulator